MPKVPERALQPLKRSLPISFVQIESVGYGSTVDMFGLYDVHVRLPVSYVHVITRRVVGRMKTRRRRARRRRASMRYARVSICLDPVPNAS